MSNSCLTVFCTPDLLNVIQSYLSVSSASNLSMANKQISNCFKKIFSEEKQRVLLLNKTFSSQKMDEARALLSNDCKNRKFQKIREATQTLFFSSLSQQNLLDLLTVSKESGNQEIVELLVTTPFFRKTITSLVEDKIYRRLTHPNSFVIPTQEAQLLRGHVLSDKNVETSNCTYDELAKFIQFVGLDKIHFSYDRIFSLFVAALEDRKLDLVEMIVDSKHGIEFSQDFMEVAFEVSAGRDALREKLIVLIFQKAVENNHETRIEEIKRSKYAKIIPHIATVGLENDPNPAPRKKLRREGSIT